MVQKGKFTKHYFEGVTRVVSKLGEGTFSHKNTGIMAGGLDYLKRTQKEQEARDRYIKGLNVPPGPPTQHGIYATPEWTKQPYPSIDWQAISQNQEPPAGWPRYPRFNEPGDVPGPPVQFGPPVTNANVKAGHGFIPNGVEEKNLYYYHPDHLGSSSYITDREGQIIQHTEYIAFGETFVDEHSVSPTQPYLFNGKELDYETGLYYYGARYYDAKTSLWLNTDPLSGYNPIQEVEHYIDGEHNEGIYNFGNLNTYTYTYQNPVIYVDPNGKQFIPAPIQPFIRPTMAMGKAELVTTAETMSSVGRTSARVSRTTETISKQQENFTRGRKIEAEQIEQMIKEGQNVSRNTKTEKGIDPKTGKEGTTIPDAKTSSGRNIEIKNVKKQSYTRQLRLQDAVSKEGRLILRINKDAKLTKPLLESGIEVQFYGTGTIKMDGGIRAQYEKRNFGK